jgi:hypothetical protein
MGFQRKIEAVKNQPASNHEKSKRLQNLQKRDEYRHYPRYPENAHSACNRWNVALQKDVEERPGNKAKEKGCEKEQEGQMDADLHPRFLVDTFAFFRLMKEIER